MPDEDLVAALGEHATPLSATAPDADLDDLVPLVEHLRDADVVGLGEATHGTRECFQLKHRVIRFLVAELGVRTVAFEADAAEMVAVADAVQRGEGDPVAALSTLDMWQWRTREVGALLRWLRSFNDGRPPEDRVRVRGVDLSVPAAPAAALRDALAAAGVGAEVTAGLDGLADHPLPDEEADRATYLAEAEDLAADAAALLERRHGAVVAATDERRWARARQWCRVLEQTCEWHRVRHEHDGPHREGMATRDRLMAENVEWCLERDPGAGVAVWAHNSHVQRGRFDDGTAWTDAETMGERLARSLGDRYRPLGVDVARGTARAVERGGDGEATAVSLDEPQAGTATAHLDALETPCYLDLAAAGDDPGLASWFDREGRIRWVGSVYDPDAEAATHYQDTDLPAAFDGLFVLGESTPTQPLGGT